MFASHGRLKRGRDPFVERIGGLHVVVPVDQHGGGIASTKPFAVDDRMAFGLNDFCRKACRAELVPYELSCAANIGLSSRVGTHAGNSQELFQFVDIAIGILDEEVVEGLSSHR